MLNFRYRFLWGGVPTFNSLFLKLSFNLKENINTIVIHQPPKILKGIKLLGQRYCGWLWAQVIPLKNKVDYQG